MNKYIIVIYESLALACFVGSAVQNKAEARIRKRKKRISRSINLRGINHIAIFSFNNIIIIIVLIACRYLDAPKFMCMQMYEAVLAFN